MYSLLGQRRAEYKRGYLWHSVTCSFTGLLSLFFGEVDSCTHSNSCRNIKSLKLHMNTLPAHIHTRIQSEVGHTRRARGGTKALEGAMRQSTPGWETLVTWSRSSSISAVRPSVQQDSKVLHACWTPSRRKFSRSERFYIYICLKDIGQVSLIVRPQTPSNCAKARDRG